MSICNAIIGGTGFENLGQGLGQEQILRTEYGIANVTISDDIVYLSRHGKAHDTPPHMINYRANIKALEELGVKHVIAIYAVGSISEKLEPGGVSIISDFIDCTSGRKTTFHDGGASLCRHVDMSDPFDIYQGKMLKEGFLKEGLKVGSDVVYVTTNGPRLETKAEICAYRILGADVVGMTAASECILMREAGISMTAVCYSINWAAGVHPGAVDFLPDVRMHALCDQITSVCRKAFA